MSDSKSVLLRIGAKYCKMIFERERRYERRYNKPNIPTPFKVYIYCPHDTSLWKIGQNLLLGGSIDIPNAYLLNHSVIGEFICSDITTERGFYHWNISELKLYDTPKPLSDFHLTYAPKPPLSWIYV